MPSTIAQKLEALLPDPSTRSGMLSIFGDSMEFIRARKPEWCHARFSGKRVRLFAGRLIVLTLHGDDVWVTTDPSAQSEDLTGLLSWRWDTKAYARYRRIPSRNGSYTPRMDCDGDWAAIQGAHFAYLERALSPGIAPDPRTADQHDVALVEYIDGLTRADHVPRGDSPLKFAPARPDVGGSFTHSEVFPLIARLILFAAHDRPGQFVTHDALVSQVLADENGAAIVARSRAKSSWSDDRSAASNMIAWFSQQISVGRSEWVDFFDRERIDGAWAYRPVAAATPANIPDFELSALEGEPRMFFHLRRERDAALASAKRAAGRNSSGQLECEACGFIAELAYPGLGAEVCEVHHRKPLAELAESVETRLSDLAILCPNCHRAIHQTKPMMRVEDFRQRLRDENVRDGTG